MNIVEVKNLYKIFGKDTGDVYPLLRQNTSKEKILEETGCVVALNDVNLEIKKGETFVLMGLSGSGKSTFIRCLNRLIEPTKGEILINGNNVTELSSEKLREVRRKTMSMVFQNFGLFPHRTVLTNVEYGLEVAGEEKEVREKKAMESLELVGLKGYEQSFPHELSGGMQQRVGLARALANDPEVLLMDEAFSALDPLIRTQMQDELLDLQEKMHKTIVFITHDLDEALKLGDRIAILGSGGVVRQIGTPEEILNNPADSYVKSFVENVDKTKVIKASTIMKKPLTITIPKDGPNMAVRKLEKAGLSTLFVTDSHRILQGVVRIDDAVLLQKKKQSDIVPIIDTDVSITSPETPVGDLLNAAWENKYPVAVVDDYHRLLGIVDRASILAEVDSDYENVLLSDATPEKVLPENSGGVND
ncbi:MAG: ABC transporter ATP-binding protein [Melioribacteraceae bacterium]|nr:MAG: ABC transporter ATP-binding protein [Melioribacteraceae bacterium]